MFFVSNLLPTAVCRARKATRDERIRKALLSIVLIDKAAGYTKGYKEKGITCDDAIAYLEKQKETLHISESCKENAEYFTAQCGDNRFELIDKAKRDIIAQTNIESSPDEMKVLDSFLFRAWQMGWLGKYDVIVPEQKPAWSEEDEMYLSQAIETLEHETYFILADKLKSLRPQPHWKPSEGQMEALLWCVAHLGGADRRVLAELYEHLKKL